MWSTARLRSSVDDSRRNRFENVTTNSTTLNRENQTLGNGLPRYRGGGTEPLPEITDTLAISRRSDDYFCFPEVHGNHLFNLPTDTHNRNHGERVGFVQRYLDAFVEGDALVVSNSSEEHFLLLPFPLHDDQEETTLQVRPVVIILVLISILLGYIYM